MTKLILHSSNGEIDTVVINRPEKRNSLTPDMLTELESVLSTIESNTTTRLVIIRGSGDHAFSTGADLASFAKHDRESARRSWIPTGHRVFRKLAQLPQITVAFLNGDAFGGGLELALACDFRVAKNTSRVGLPEVGIGTLPGWGGTGRLVDYVGVTRAKQLVLTGEIISAGDAFAWGLITKIADSESIDQVINDFSAQILRAAPIAQQMGKQLMSAFEENSKTEVLEALAGALTVTTEDLAEGITAFQEKRRPQFKGK